MSKPVAVPARPGPSHTPLLASADDTAPSQPVSPRPGPFRGVLVTITVTRTGRCSEMWSKTNHLLSSSRATGRRRAELRRGGCRDFQGEGTFDASHQLAADTMS